MTDLPKLHISETNLTELATREGAIAVFVTPDNALDQSARKVNGLTKKGIMRTVDNPQFAKAKVGEAVVMSYPVGLAAGKVIVVKLPRRPSVEEARKAGGVYRKSTW